MKDSAPQTNRSKVLLAIIFGLILIFVDKCVNPLIGAHVRYKQEHRPTSVLEADD